MTPKLSRLFGSAQTAPDLSVLEDGSIAAFRATEEAKSLVSWVQQEYRKAKGARSRTERQWLINLAFYGGKQNLQYLPAGRTGAAAGKLIEPPAPSYSSRKVTNRIRPIIRTEMARLTSNKPNASVVPASSEDEDLFAAQAGEQIWEAMYSGKKLNKRFSETAFWVCICGTSFTKVWWDPDKYDTVTKENGSVESGTVSPFHLFVPDLTVVEIEDQPWVMNVYTKSPSWVKRQYDVVLKPSVTTINNPLEGAMFMTGNSENQPDSVLVYEMWLKPGQHDLFPEGGMITICDDILVDMTPEWPYQHKEFPFIKWDHIPTGMFYSESVITDLLDPQREFNRTKNQIIEAKNRMAKPQLLAAKGSIEASKVTSQPGQIIFYKPGLDRPSPLPIQPLPAYVLQALQQEMSDMEDISSQHQVSRGGAPAGVTAATAISFMQERDDALLTTAYQSIEAGWEKWAKQTLALCVQYWDVQRTISVTGVDGSFDAIVLKNTELQKGTDIRMEAGSALPTSKAAKQAFLLDLMKLGFVDPTKGLELMEMGGIEKLYDELKVDERQAQRENLRMKKLEIDQIMQHVQMVEQQNMMAQQMSEQQAMMQPSVDPMQMQQPMLGMPPEGGEMPPEEMGMDQGFAPDPALDPNTPPEMGAAGIDPNTQMPLQLPINIVPVNTWDNHQLHIDVHNRFRKTQAFDMLPDEIKEQFEAHVAQHAMALNAAASQAAMMPPPPAGMGAQNGSDTPLGSNQFGPPGTEQGAPPPEMMGM